VETLLKAATWETKTEMRE